MRDIVVRHEYKNRAENQRIGATPTENWVLECTARVMNCLRRSVFLSAGSRAESRIILTLSAASSANGTDRVKVKVCTDRGETCSHCAEEHRFTECRPERKDVACVNGKREGECDHP